MAKSKRDKPYTFHEIMEEGNKRFGAPAWFAANDAACNMAVLKLGITPSNPKFKPVIPGIVFATLLSVEKREERKVLKRFMVSACIQSGIDEEIVWRDEIPCLADHTGEASRQVRKYIEGSVPEHDNRIQPRILIDSVEEIKTHE